MLPRSSGADEVALPFIEIDRLADRSRRPGRVSACPENLGQLHQEVCAEVRHLSRHEANGFDPEIGRCRTRAARRRPAPLPLARAPERQCSPRARCRDSASRAPPPVPGHAARRRARGARLFERWCRGGAQLGQAPAHPPTAAPRQRRRLRTAPRSRGRAQEPSSETAHASVPVPTPAHGREEPEHRRSCRASRAGSRANRGPPGARDPRPRRAARTRESPPELESDRRPRPTPRVCERPLPLVVVPTCRRGRGPVARPCSISCISAARKCTYART